MQQVMAEVRQLGALDPTAQDKLMTDLMQTDASLWPLVLQQFRAAVAYRRQAGEREPGQGTAPPSMQAADAGSAGEPPRSPPAAESPAKPRAEVGPSPQEAAGAVGTPPQSRSAERPAEKPSADKSRPGPAAAGRGGEVVAASHETPVPQDWRAQLDLTIRTLEAETKEQPKSEAEIAQLARLRMLYALAGRRDDAVRPIPATPSAVQDFWSKELFGLSTLLDTERNADGPRRAAETKGILEEALARLGETAPLVVRNLAFCTSVQSYGSNTPFKKYEFSPGQELLLYAEVENFGVESTPKGHHTVAAEQLPDFRQPRPARGGARVQQHRRALPECPRRDFFIGYHLRLPKRVYSGKHTLQLTVEDLKSRKVGQSTIEFTVKGGEE